MSILQHGSEAFKTKLLNFKFWFFFCYFISNRDLNTKKTPLKIEACPERLGVVSLEY